MPLLVLLLVMNFFYAGTPAMTKIAGLSLHPLQIVFLRHTLACLAFLPLFLRLPSKKILPQDLGKMMLGSFFAFTLASILQTLAMRYAQAADGAFIMAMEPVMVIFLAYLFLKERLNIKIVGGLFLAMLGFLILSDSFSSQSLFHSRFTGNFLFLLSISAEATFPIILKPLLARYPPTLIAFYCLLFASIYTLPLQWGLPPIPLEGVALLPVFYLGLGCSFFGCLLWLTCLSRMSATLVAISWFVQPVFGCLFALILLNEVLPFGIWVGGSFILAALGLISSHPLQPVVVIQTTFQPAQTLVRIQHPLRGHPLGGCIPFPSSLNAQRHVLPQKFSAIHPVAMQRRSRHRALYRRHHDAWAT